MTARRVVAAVAACALVLTAAGALAEDPAPGEGGVSADELRAIEAAVAADAAAPQGPARPVSPPAAGQGSGNPNIALILDVAAAYYSERDSLQLGAHDASVTGFNFQQLELHFDASVDPYFRVDANLVFALFGVELEEAYATSLALPGGLQLRVGQFLHRLGRVNATHPHAWSFADQPLVNGKFFGGEGSRGLGLELSWLLPLPWYVEASTSVTGATGACCARSFYGGDDPGTDGVEDLLLTSALQQFFDLSADWAVLVGLSAQLGPNANGHRSRTNILGSDLLLRFKPTDSTRGTSLDLQGEVLVRSRQVPDDSLQDVGLYAQLVYRIDRRWEVGARYDWVGGVDSDPLDPEWSGSRGRTSLQTTFYPSHFSRIRLQGKHDRPTWLDRPIWGVTAAAEFMIGAHGAHAY